MQSSSTALSSQPASAEEHQWGPWQYTIPGQCIQVRACQECGHQEERAMHQWQDTQHRNDDICVHFVCQRCGEQRFRPHKFMIHGNRSEAYKCQECGYIRRRRTAFLRT